MSITIINQEPRLLGEVQSMIIWYLNNVLNYQDIEVTDRFAESSEDRTVIIMALHSFHGKLPNEFIAVQMEQLVSQGVSHLTTDYLNRLKQAKEVWDYSPVNYRLLSQEKGLTNVRLMNIGHCPELLCQSTTGEDNRDYPAVFIGGINERRQECLDFMSQEVEVKKFTNIWGEQRDQVLDRSQVFLNIHFFSPSILETTRIITLLSRGALIISEKSQDPVLDRKFQPLIYLVNSWQEMREKAVELTNLSKQEREQIRQEIFNKFNQANYQFSLKSRFLTRQEKASSSEVQIKNKEQSDSQKEKNEVFDSTFSQKEKNEVFDSTFSQKEKSKFKMIDMKKDDQGRISFPEVKAFKWENMPMVSLLTPFYANQDDWKSKVELFQMVLRCFDSFIYPPENIEWLILDDSPREWLKPSIPDDSRIRYIYMGDVGKMPIAQKRNKLVERSFSNYLIHIDADDFYYPETIWNRVSILKSYRKLGQPCLGCHRFPIFDLETGRVGVVETHNISEASLAYTKDFWMERNFSNRDSNHGESPPFLQGREEQVVSIPFNLNWVPITHNCNVTGRLRKIQAPQDEDPDNYLTEKDLFNSYDSDYLFSLYQSLFK